MHVITRFAPSPTGFLHVGNIRTALTNWLLSRANGGKFILRIDDTDIERSKQLYVDGIKRDLSWLGLYWDEIFFQSERFERYREVQKKLIAEGRLYPCYETQEELEIKKKALLGRNLPPIYDRASLSLTEGDKVRFEERGVKPHWRFLLVDSVIDWVDGIKGPMNFSASNLSDPILIKADGSMTYTLASVVDDIDFSITHIIRGEDHLSNSAIHVQLFEALNGDVPKLAHLALLNSKSHEISKRLGGFDIASLKQLGIHHMAINSLLSKIGTSDPIKPFLTLDDLIASFNLNKFGKSPANYDQNELEKLNAKLMHNMPYDLASSFLKEAGIQGVDQFFWDVAKNNINTLSELKQWLRICCSPLEPTNLDCDYLKLAADLLPKEPWNDKTWDLWINQIKTVTKKSGTELFIPIRVALTGQERGPELKVLLPLLGYDKAFKRLNGEVA